MMKTVAQRLKADKLERMLIISINHEVKFRIRILDVVEETDYLIAKRDRQDEVAGGEDNDR